MTGSSYLESIQPQSPLKMTSHLISNTNTSSLSTTSLTTTSHLSLPQQISLSVISTSLLRHDIKLNSTADKTYFQVQFGPIDYCLDWGVSSQKFHVNVASGMVAIPQTTSLKLSFFFCRKRKLVSWRES